jgi:GAF domain-containing protein
MVVGDKKKLIGIVSFVSVIVIVAIIAAIYLYNILKWADYPDFGYGWRSATGIETVGVVTESGRIAGLHVGDRFLMVNGRTFSNIDEFRSAMRRNVGEKNTYLIEREGQKIEIAITNSPLGFTKSFSKSGYPFVLGLCFVAIGVLVFLMKPNERPSWIFFIFTSIFGLFVTFIYKLGVMKPFWLETVSIFTYTFIPACFIHLSLSFPAERDLIKKYPYTQIIPYILSATLFLGIRYLTPTMTDAPPLGLAVVVVYLAISILFFLGSNFQLRITSSSAIVKLRARVILLGFAIAASLPLTDFVINTFFHIYILPSFNYYLPFFVAIPSFIGYSIVKHDLFDIDAIIKRTYGYLITTGALAGIYGIIVLVSNLAFGRFQITKSPLFPLVFVLAVIFLFNPVRNRMQKFIDRVFYRLEYDYRETVQRISESMRTLLGLDEIGKSIMDTAIGVMFIDSGRVMLLDKQKQAYECLTKAGMREKKNGPRNGGAAETGTGVPGQAIEAVACSEPAELALLASDPFIQKIAERKREVTIYDIQEDPLFEDQTECLARKVLDQMEATLVVPLIYENDLIGMISLGEKKSGKFYRREDINLLNTLANQGAVAIENARMVEEVVEKERMEEELNIARDLQVSMLPSETRKLRALRLRPLQFPPGKSGEISMILLTWVRIKPAWLSVTLPAKVSPVRWSCPHRAACSACCLKKNLTLLKA